MIIDICVIHSGPASGDLTYFISPDDASVTNYRVEAYVAGSQTLVATLDLGKPGADPTGLVTYNIRSWLNTLAPGNYDVTVLAMSAGGNTESVVSNAFTVPVP